MSEKEYPARAPKDAQELWEIHSDAMWKIAWIFHRRYPMYLELEEKVSYVFMGMLSCLEKFDESRGVRFISYAYKSGYHKLDKAVRDERRQACHPGSLNEPGKYGVLLQTSCNFQEPKNGDHARDGRGADAVTFACFKAGAYNESDPILRIEARRTYAKFKECLPRGHKGGAKYLARGWNMKEIAKKLKITRQAVHAAYTRARKKMDERV